MIEHNTCIAFHESSYTSLANEYANTTVKEEPNSFYYCNNYYINDNIPAYVGESDPLYVDQHQQHPQASNDISPPSSNGSFDSYAPSPLHQLSVCNTVYKSESLSVEGTSSDDTICSSFSLNSAMSPVDSHDLTACHGTTCTLHSLDVTQTLDGITAQQSLAQVNASTGDSLETSVSSFIASKQAETDGKIARTKSPCLPDTCKKCGSHFDDDRLLVRHMKVDHYYTEVLHFTESDPTDRQKRYDEWFKKQMNRTSLPKEMNGQYFKPFKCDICSRHYSYKGTLARHRFKRHDLSTFIDGQLVEPSAAPSDKYLGSFTCDTCGFTAGSRKLFERHVLRKHFQGMQPYPCDQCSESFDRSDRLLWHRRQKHAKEPLFTCDKCGRSYRTKLVYERHQRLQHSGHQFKCKECPKVFKSYASFDYHRRKHKGVQGMKFICEYCGFRFWSNQNRRKHINKCHSDGQIDPVAIEQNANKDWSKEAAVTRSTGRCNTTTGSDNRSTNKCTRGATGGGKQKKTETDVKIYKQENIYSTGVSVNSNGVSIVTNDVNDFSITRTLIDNAECKQDKRLNHFTGSPPSPPPQSSPPSPASAEGDGHDGALVNGNASVRRNGFNDNDRNTECVRQNSNNDAAVAAAAAAAVPVSPAAATTTTITASTATTACHNGPSVDDEVKRRVHLSMQHARDLSNAPLALPTRPPPPSLLLPQMTHASADGQATRLNTSSDTSLGRSCPGPSPLCHYNVPNSLNRPMGQLNGTESRVENYYPIRHTQAQVNEPHLTAAASRGNLLVTNTHSHAHSSMSAPLGHIDTHTHTAPHLHSFNGAGHQHRHFHDHSISLQEQLLDNHGRSLLQQQQIAQCSGHEHQLEQQTSYLVSVNNHLQPVYHENNGQRISHGEGIVGGGGPTHHITCLNETGRLNGGHDNLLPISGMTSHLTSCLSSSTSSMDRCKMCFECVYNMRGHLMNQHSVAFEALDYFLDL